MIEYQGSQHTKESLFFGGQDQLLYTQTHDAYKRYWCRQRGINLISIDYKDYNNIKDILDNKINFLERRYVI